MRRLVLAYVAALLGVGVAVACSSSGDAGSPSACQSLATCCGSVSGAQQQTCVEVVTSNVATSCSAELASLQTSGVCVTVTQGSSTSNGCAGLETCCAGMTGASAQQCMSVVSAGAAVTCNADLAAYQAAGACKSGTGTGSGPESGCVALASCCANMTGSAAAACNEVVGAGSSATCTAELAAYEGAGACAAPGTGTGTGTQATSGPGTGTGTGTGVGCSIDGVLYVTGVPNPVNSCQFCDPAASTTSWSNSAAGTVCGAGEACSNGVCSSSSVVSCQSPTPTQQACSECETSQCASAVAAEQTACTTFNACFVQCTCSNTSCIDACIDAAPSACLTALQSISSCSTTTCATACGTTTTGTCPTSCTTNSECSSACPATPGAISCCDQVESACFTSASTTCPSTTGGDAGTMY